MKKGLKLLAFAAVLVAAVGCTVESYDSGDGDYSYLKAEFAMVNTNSEAKISGFVTDDDFSVAFDNPVAVKNAKADTVYRALVYYDSAGTPPKTLRGLKMVGVCRPFGIDDTRQMVTDPVGWESMWVSRNKRFVNLSLDLLVGVADSDYETTGHMLAVRLDNVARYSEDAHRHVFYTLFHDQNGVPEYYTAQTFLSIPLNNGIETGDSITMTVNTYAGVQEKTVIVR